MIDPKLNVSRDLHISNSRFPCAQVVTTSRSTIFCITPTFRISVNDPKNVYLSLLSYLRTSPPYRRLRLRSSSRAQKTHFQTEIASKPGKNDCFFFLPRKGFRRGKAPKALSSFRYIQWRGRSMERYHWRYSSLSEKTSFDIFLANWNWWKSNEKFFLLVFIFSLEKLYI